jgi:bacillithiol biosynthesis deacetylase BshB1
MKVDILAMGVHPDDIELSCAGTLLKHIDMGKTVGLLDLTKGELGTRGSASLRMKEAEAASKLMGASLRGNLGMKDGFFEYSQANLLKIIQVIRLTRPEIVLANAISDRHPDHGRAAKLCADACFYAGLSKIQTEWEGVTQVKWRPKALYHYIQDNYIEPDFVVDISAYFKQKMELIQCYKSQFYDVNSAEPTTPISSKHFIETIKSKNVTFGRPASFDYAEGFTVNRTLGVENLFDLA